MLPHTRAFFRLLVRFLVYDREGFRLICFFFRRDLLLLRCEGVFFLSKRIFRHLLCLDGDRRRLVGPPFPLKEESGGFFRFFIHLLCNAKGRVSSLGRGGTTSSEVVYRREHSLRVLRSSDGGLFVGPTVRSVPPREEWFVVGFFAFVVGNPFIFSVAVGTVYESVHARGSRVSFFPLPFTPLVTRRRVASGPRGHHLPTFVFARSCVRTPNHEFPEFVLVGSVLFRFWVDGLRPSSSTDVSTPFVSTFSGTQVVVSSSAVFVGLLGLTVSKQSTVSFFEATDLFSLRDPLVSSGIQEWLPVASKVFLHSSGFEGNFISS